MMDDVRLHNLKGRKSFQEIILKLMWRLGPIEEKKVNIS
jgi:predicted CopG family antitoxin